MSGSTSFERFLSASGRKTSGPPSPDAGAAREASHTSPSDSQQLSPNDSGTSQGGRAGEASDEWHLSSIEEMASLNWGDGSKEGEGLSGDVEGQTESSAVDGGSQEAAPGLVPNNVSPPRQRLSSSTLPAPRVQFSPLSLCPSPLLGLPAPRTPHDTPTTRHLPRSVRAILKAPGTPGTGRSVRFSASIREQSISHFADISVEGDSRFTNAASEVYEDVEEEDELSEASHTSDGSHIVASFLSKLQAAIPSPEASHTESSIIVPTYQPLVTVSSPTDTSKSFKIDRVYGLGTDENIFDTSAPQFGTGEDWSIANDERITHRALTSSQNPFLSVSARLSSTLVPLPQAATRPITSSPSPSDPLGSTSSSPIRPPSQSDSSDSTSLMPTDATTDAPDSDNETYDASWTDPSVYGTPQASSRRESPISSPDCGDEDGDEEELDTSQQLEHSQYYNLDATIDISTRDSSAALADSTNPGAVRLYDQTQYHDITNTSLWESAPSSPSSPPTSLVTYAPHIPHLPPSTEHTSSTALDSTGSLIAALLSVQGDMLSNSSSQRQLLSSFVASLQNEVTRKDKFIARLSERNALIEVELERIEAVNSSHAVPLDPFIDQDRLTALNHVIEQLTTQMAVDHASIEEERSARDAEVSSLRTVLGEAKTSVRDSEIRLHHAQVSQLEAEVSRTRAQEEVDQQRNLYNKLAVDAEEMQADRNDLRLRLHYQRGDHENAFAELEGELSVVRASLLDAEERHAELVLAGDQDLVHAEGLRSAHQATIDALTQQVTLTREENDRLCEQVTELRRLGMDDRVELERTSSELESLRQQVVGKDDELDVALAQIATLRRTQAEHSDAISTRDGLLHAQSLELDELNDLVRRSRVQSEDQATEDIEPLRSAMEELEVARQERSQEDECNRMKELVRTLRRESADREVKLLRLQRIKSELTEDCLGLNIALDAKQQEVQLWKRQASTRAPLVASIGPSDTALRPPSHLLPFETPSRSTRRVKGTSRRPATGTVLKENERPRQEVPALR